MLFCHWFWDKTILPQHDLIIMKASGKTPTQPKANDPSKFYLQLSYFCWCLALAHPHVPDQTELVAGMRTNFKKCIVRHRHYWSVVNGLLVFIFPTEHSFGTLGALKCRKISTGFPQDCSSTGYFYKIIWKICYKSMVLPFYFSNSISDDLKCFLNKHFQRNMLIGLLLAPI